MAKRKTKRLKVTAVSRELSEIDADLQTLCGTHAAQAIFLDSDVGRALLAELACRKISLEAVQRAPTLEVAQQIATSALANRSP